MLYNRLFPDGGPLTPTYLFCTITKSTWRSCMAIRQHLLGSISMCTYFYSTVWLFVQGEREAQRDMSIHVQVHTVWWKPLDPHTGHKWYFCCGNLSPQCVWSCVPYFCFWNLFSQCLWYCVWLQSLANAPKAATTHFTLYHTVWRRPRVMLPITQMHWFLLITWLLDEVFDMLLQTVILRCSLHSVLQFFQLHYRKCTWAYWKCFLTAMFLASPNPGLCHSTRALAIAINCTICHLLQKRNLTSTKLYNEKFELYFLCSFHTVMFQALNRYSNVPCRNPFAKLYQLSWQCSFLESLANGSSFEITHDQCHAAWVIFSLVVEILS